MTEATGETSRERMSLLNEDVLVTAGLADEQEAEVPVLPALDAVEEGRQVNSATSAPRSTGRSATRVR